MDKNQSTAAGVVGGGTEPLIYCRLPSGQAVVCTATECKANGGHLEAETIDTSVKSSPPAAADQLFLYQTRAGTSYVLGTYRDSQLDSGRVLGAFRGRLPRP